MAFIAATFSYLYFVDYQTLLSFALAAVLIIHLLPG